MDNLGNDDFSPNRNNNGVPPQNGQQNNGSNGGDSSSNSGSSYLQQNGGYERQSNSGYAQQQGIYTQQGYNSGGVNGGMGQNTASQPPRPQQTQQSAAQNQARATAKFMPTNMPPASANTSTGDLNKEEIEYLRKISDQNFVIKKRLKKSKGRAFDEPRALSKVRRLYSLNFARKYYGFPPVQVKKLRDRSGDDKGAIFGAAARRVKKIILTMVILVAIIATLGTGAVVAIMAINSNSNIFVDENGLLIVNADQIVPIDGYSLGQWQENDFIIKMRNQTNIAIKDVTFRITLSPIKGEYDSDDAYAQRKKAFADALENGTIDPTQLVFSYSYDKSLWEMAPGQQVYVDKGVIYGPMLKYIGGENGIIQSSSNQDNDIQVIRNFAIDIVSSAESNKWVNFSMRISFVVQAENVDVKDYN